MQIRIGRDEFKPLEECGTEEIMTHVRMREDIQRLEGCLALETNGLLAESDYATLGAGESSGDPRAIGLLAQWRELNEKIGEMEEREPQAA